MWAAADWIASTPVMYEVSATGVQNRFELFLEDLKPVAEIDRLFRRVPWHR